MANRIITDEAFLITALDLFRTYGFEGVSLKQLADATGLEKASLYYRYPGGKDEIVLAVATAVSQWLETNIAAPLAGPGTPRKRVACVVERLRELYCGGTKSCVIDVLSIPGGSPELKTGLKAAMQSWLNAYVEIAKECGLTPVQARHRAEEAMVRFEGSLVLARVLGDTSAFDRTLKLLPDLLTVA